MKNRLELKKIPAEKREITESMERDSAMESFPRLRVFDILRILIRRRTFIATFTFGVAVSTTIITLLIPNEYDSYASILPSGQSDKLADLKSLTGMGEAKTDENSSELFPTIIESHLLKKGLLEDSFVIEHEAQQDTISLIEYFDEFNYDKLRAELGGIITVKTDKKTGVITVRARTEYPELSQQILSRLLTDLEMFNLHKRRSRGKENEVYLARQLKQKKKELSAAEEALEDFRKLNRNWASSSNPDILLNLGRLEREVQVNTDTYLFLSRELEAAKFEARKDVPIVRVLDQPTLPTVKSTPQRATTVTIATVMAFLTALTAVAVGEMFRRLKAGPEKTSYATYRQDFAEAFPRMNRLLEKTSYSKMNKVAT